MTDMTSFPTPDEAELAFYRAFETNDHDAMMAVWDQAEDIICVHPMGPPLNGLQEVSQSWREILSGEPSIRFSLEPIRNYTHDDYAIRVLNEHIQVSGGERVAPMVATNIYRLTPRGWRMVSHHASPNPGIETGQTPTRLH